ncbi:MAG: alpha-amylase, partial [Alistipes sp.]|nr:alpha-amylase [Alistipes sp.]
MKRFLLFVAALAVAVSADARHPIPEWLRDAVIYHIYPSTYKDSDGDGIGDLEGIRFKLDYIGSVGFNTIWISP